MLNVVIINDAARVTGGAGQVALGSAIGLANKGVRVTLFAAVGPIAPELTAAGVQVVLVGQEEVLSDPNRIRAAIQGLWNVQAERLLDHTLKALNPKETIVHLHSWVKALSPSVVRTVVNRGFPLVCTLHDYFTSCPNGGYFNYPKNEICTLKPLSSACVLSNCDVRSYSHKLWRVARHWVQREWGKMPGKVTNYIYNSTFSREIASTYLPDDASYFNIPPFIDLEPQQSVDCSRSDIFAVVGRLTKEKGCLLFAEATRRVGVRCLFIGDGDIRQEILRVNPNAMITGWLSRSEVTRQLRSIRALVYPTLWYETYGMAVLEAAGVGVPSIVGRRCAAQELVNDGVTGILFNSGDVEDLSRQIKKLQKDDNLVRNLGRAAHEKYWADPISIDRHISALMTTYQFILKESPNQEKT